MRQRFRATYFWSTVLLVMAAVTLLAACSGGDQVLLAEFNRDGETEIFLATLGDEPGEWQSLVKDARPARLFEEGNLAAFVPGEDRILLWYQDRDDILVDYLEIGADTPINIFDAREQFFLFGEIVPDPFTVFINESRDFGDFRCYLSRDGAEADRVARATTCGLTENGVISIEINDRNEKTVTSISLDGEAETVWLDDAEEIGQIAFNEDLTQLAYVETRRNDAQLMLLEDDEDPVELGDEFAEIGTVVFLPDGRSVLIVARVRDDDEEVGLYLNAGGDPLLEANEIRLLQQSEDKENFLFLTNDGRESALFVYNADNEIITEVVEDDVVTDVAYVPGGRLLLSFGRDDELAMMSANADGTEAVTLFDDNDFRIDLRYVLPETNQLLLQVTDQDGLRSVYISSLEAENGFFLLEEWASVDILNATEDVLIFLAREDEGDDWGLFMLPLEEGATEIMLDETRSFLGGTFVTANGRSLVYTAIEEGLTDTEVRQVPLDGSESPERLYRDFVLLDVNWNGRPNLEQIR